MYAPVYAPETTPQHLSGSEPRGVAAPPVRLNVLVVEDEDASREVLVKAVRWLGHECRGARDGLEAWGMQQRQRADVILSDWQMPGMDGLELCRRVRTASAESHYTYFILLTSFTDKGHFLRGMEAGADDFHTKPVDLDELRVRLASAARVVAIHRSLAEQNAILRRASQTSFRMARLDALTEVANRFAMDEDLRVLWARVNRYGHRYSIAICDIDRFKAFNDCFGHLAGDEVLRRVAQTIRGELRAGDSLYRYGGEEFVVVLPDQRLADARRALERVRAAVERLAIPACGERPIVTVSCGVAELQPSADATSDDWLGRADSALYRAKSAGRNRVETDAGSGPRRR
jgi:two-component system chemotaxis response regulator CheY